MHFEFWQTMNAYIKKILNKNRPNSVQKQIGVQKKSNLQMLLLKANPTHALDNNFFKTVSATNKNPAQNIAEW